MKLKFYLDYNTYFGEEIVLNIVGAGGNVSKHAMATVNGHTWTCETTLAPAAHSARSIEYYYSVECDGRLERHEWAGKRHLLDLAASKATRVTIFDHWIDIPQDSYHYSSAITECLAHRDTVTVPATDYDTTVMLKVCAPQLRAGDRLALVGSGQALGSWSVLKAITMAEHSRNEWVAVLDASQLKSNVIEFKFVAFSNRDDKTILWEVDGNRTVTLPELKKGDCVVYELPTAGFPIGDWRIAGTVVPVFSLKTAGSFGVGDFGDLKHMIDYVASTGQKALQVLPINDTTITHTWTDSYPYNCISIYALHPQYIDLRQLPQLADASRRQHYSKLQAELNALPKIDYERVNQAKLAYMEELYKQEGAKTMKTAEFKQYFEANKQWLVPYAAFCHYRDLYGTASFGKWPEHRTFDESLRAAMANSRTSEYKKVAYWYYVQYNLDKQMHAAHEYARQKRVVLKGDIPIGISRDGVEAWVEPKYFNLNGQAGAPPDAFSANGQNWGFPTYNWDAMLEDGCSWWVRRFRKMSQFFDAYRIDHVLGFFRIWEIPIDAVHGLLGQFSPSLGMTREEIEAYGLQFQEELFTKPFIADWTLDRVFGEKAQYVKENFLNHAHDDIWQMKPEFDTQRKVEAWYKAEAAKVTDSTSLAYLRDGLYALISDVLFVRDRKDNNKFHPRIGVQNDFIYEALWDNDKAVFNRLYNDYFYRRNNQFWYTEAMKKLPRLTQATRMLVCAEDLGMVPDCVPWVMNELRILSLEIQSMPKDPTTRFGKLSHNPYRSVDTISTHDMPTLRQWWDEDEERSQAYFNTTLRRGGEAPRPLPAWLAKDIVSRHLTSPSMLCLISFQDWLSIDEKLRLPDENAERINIPANPRHYWRYRMHLTIEQLLAADELNDEISTLIIQSGRK